MSSSTEIESPYGISFITLPGNRTLHIIDPIERHRYQLTSSQDLSFEAIDPDQFLFPVDSAVRLQTDRLKLPSLESLFVRSNTGEQILEIDHASNGSLIPGSYVIELCGPLKIYLEVEAGLGIRTHSERMEIEFDETVTVDVGARSEHDRPRGTVTITSDPTDVMTAISSFGSALKTTSPERSFPTHRGHPPKLRVGDALNVPDAFEPPDTGIIIEVPPTFESVFPVASLAFYLGATVRPGEESRVMTSTGLERSLVREGSNETGIERLLKHTFFLDCVVRTAGLYPVELYERRELERRIDLDYESLYEAPIATRLERYLQIPYAIIDDLTPRWGTAAHVSPEVSSVEILPYLVDDLAFTRVPPSTQIERLDQSAADVGTFSKSQPGITRSTVSDVTSTSQSFVIPPDTGANEQVWIGDGAPIGASKAIPKAYVNRLSRTPSTSDINITVVCNDEAMNAEESLLGEIYGSRNDLEFDVTIHRELTTDELSVVLREPSDFLHYIGHSDDQGFDCLDGKLDVAGIDDVGVTAFLLNGCESYLQGSHLIEAGGIGGIVTLSEVVNSGAVRVGQTLAKLLNTGFPLYVALGVARKESLMGVRYIVIGDGRVALTQTKSVPQIAYIMTNDDDVSFSYDTFPTERADLGTMTIPYISENTLYFLLSNTIDAFSPSKDELLTFLNLEEIPVYLDGEFMWSTEIESL